MCHKNWVQCFNLILYFNPYFFCPTPEKNVDPYIVTPPPFPHLSSTRVSWWTRGYSLFSWFVVPYFYSIKAMSWITADYMQWDIYINRETKSGVYTCIKKASTKLSRPYNLSLGKLKSMSFIFVCYLLSLTR